MTLVSEHVILSNQHSMTSKVELHISTEKMVRNIKSSIRLSNAQLVMIDFIKFEIYNNTTEEI